MIPARHLDLRRLRTRSRRGRRARAQRGEIGFQSTRHALAVLGLEPRECLDIGEQRLAATREIEDLLFEPPALGLALAPRVRLTFRNETTRLDVGVVEQLASFSGRLGNGLVGGSLGQQEGAVQDVFGLAGSARLALGRREPFGQLLEPLGGRLDGARRPLEEVVHLVAVVATE